MVLIVICGSACGFAAPSAWAGSSELKTALDEASPSILGNAGRLTPSVGAIRGRGILDGTTVALPAESATGVQVITPERRHVTIGLPSSAATETAKTLKSGAVAFDNRDGSTTVPVAGRDGSVAVNVVIANAQAPSRYEFPMTLPAGGSLEPTADGGILAIEASGEVIGSLAAPWAKDANGVAVSTHFEVIGRSVTQVVDHADPGTAYPVVADPFWIPKLIESVRRVRGLRNGFTYQVKPNKRGRLMGRLLYGVAWNQAVKKGVPRRRGLQEQFVCHPMTVVARIKATWNLDTWRPTVGLLRTLKARCNPL